MSVNQQKLSLLGGIEVEESTEHDYDYLLYRGTPRYVCKRLSNNSHKVQFVIYDNALSHKYIGDTFEFEPHRMSHWYPYRIADRSSPTIEDIKLHLQF